MRIHASLFPHLVLFLISSAGILGSTPLTCIQGTAGSRSKWTDAKQGTTSCPCVLLIFCSSVSLGILRCYYLTLRPKSRWGKGLVTHHACDWV